MFTVSSEPTSVLVFISSAFAAVSESGSPFHLAATSTSYIPFELNHRAIQPKGTLNMGTLDTERISPYPRVQDVDVDAFDFGCEQLQLYAS